MTALGREPPFNTNFRVRPRAANFNFESGRSTELVELYPVAPPRQSPHQVFRPSQFTLL